MIYTYKIFIFFIVFVTTLFSQKRIAEFSDLNTLRSASLLEVNEIPFNQIESYIEENLFGFCVDIYDLNIIASPGSVGGFSYSGNDFGISQGIILSTGNVNYAVGPNNSTCASGSHGASGDAVLNSLSSNLTTFDACTIEFDFIASSDNLLACQFIFASEEYPEYVNSWFNDVFGFFISEPYESQVGDFDPSVSQIPQNIALIPNSQIPISINNVNNLANSDYFFDNSDGDNIQYDGFTTPINIQKEIKQGVLYRLRITIADGSDDQFDSALFLKSNSFESGVEAQIGTITQTGLDVNFSNNSFGTQFYWDFGDGSYSYSSNPYHQYDSPGTYLVTLTVLDESNCGISQDTELITVTNIEEISVSDIEHNNLSLNFNPASKTIDINNFDESRKYYASIYNTIGKLELSNIEIDYHRNIIDASYLSSGPYIVHLKNENFDDVLHRKILIY